MMQLYPTLKYPDAHVKGTEIGTHPPSPSDFWLPGHLGGEEIWEDLSEGNGTHPPSPSLSHPL